MLSDGEDTASRLRDDDVLARARRSNVTVYAVGLLPTTDAARPDPAKTAALYFLTSLARETGGLAHFPQRLDQLGDVYAHVARELRSQYTLGYLPQRPGDGTWRRISVLVPTRTDVFLRHKTAYFSGPRPLL